MPSRRMRMLRAPNCDRAPNPRITTRVSCDGLKRLEMVRPGSRKSDWSMRIWGWPGRALSGRALDTENGRSSVDRPVPRVTVIEAGSFVAAES